VDAACRRGGKAILFAYEESAPQILRNMKSIGIDLEPWLRQGLLRIHASRPTLHGLEQHLVMMHDLIRDFKPAVVAVDPISNLSLERNEAEVKPTLMRLIDFLKQEQITALFTSLTSGANSLTSSEDSEVGISSLMDVWLLLRNHESNGERNRTIFVLKARGMHHSNQVREFVMTSRGIDLLDVPVGTGGVLTGSARLAREEMERRTTEEMGQAHERKLRELTGKQQEIEAKISMLRAEAESHAAEYAFVVAQAESRSMATASHLKDIARQRRAAKTNPKSTGEP
jgi:circadian clock protein KaiC